MACLPTLSIRDARPEEEGRRATVEELQERLNTLGFYSGAVDGWFGEKTEAAVKQFQRARGLAVDGITGPHTWGALYEAETKGQRLPYEDQVSAEFALEVRRMAVRLGIDAAWLMAIMAFETGGSFDPAQKNMAGSGATGLIQFMPATARGLGTSTDALAQMTPVQQLGYVEKYFQPYAGRLRTLEDTYLAVLWPAAVGKPASYVLFRAPSIAYRQNRGLDSSDNGEITKWEAAQKVREALREGLA